MGDQGWDTGETFVVGETPEESPDTIRDANAENAFFKFLKGYRAPDDTFYYRDLLRRNYNGGRYYIQVELDHVLEVNQNLGQLILEKPSQFLPIFERAAKKAADDVTKPRTDDGPVRDIQIMLSSSQNLMPIRDLDSSSVGRLVKVTGIIIKAGTVRTKATNLVIQCRNCGKIRELHQKPGFGGVMLPRTCNRDAVPEADEQRCPMDPYDIVADKCTCVDQQVLKIQETPETVPTGEMPRTVMITCDRYLTLASVPGARVVLIGVYDVFTPKDKRGNKDATRLPYIRAVGFMDEANEITQGPLAYSSLDRAEFDKLSKDPDLYNKIAGSIAPKIYGFEDIKKSAACLLFGGSRKQLPDGMRLRGDINMLLLGDPGTAKSQLLKTTEKLAPVAVYTSGKGSSAAGLTASVMQDPMTREFFLEAGAMVLADGGVVCIDEFDKMREEDRVAIHEAMEQQTISIAKAGITTVLNTRTSVLAAANSTFGRWDDSQEAADNLEFQTTVLSRFDMIYIIKDKHDPEQDERLARFVISHHQAATEAQVGEQAKSPIDPDFLKKYIDYARRTCGPRLHKDAVSRLANEFVTIRQTAKKSKSGIPITVRQLEAIVRISESLAKMSLSKFATWTNVEEALRLFKQSTLQAATHEELAGIEGMTREVDMDAVLQVERRIQRRLGVGQVVSKATLVNDFTARGFNEYAALKAIDVMVARGELKYRLQGKAVTRVR